MTALQKIEDLLSEIKPVRTKPNVYITSIELYVVTIPFVRPYRTAVGTRVHQSNVICKINTNVRQLFGFGEACPVRIFTEETIDSIFRATKEEIFPLIKHKDALDVDGIEQLLAQHVDEFHIMAKGMINMALWDIFGKYHEKPIYECLSDSVCHTRIPLLYPFGDQSIEEDTRMLREKMGQGFRTFMLKMGCNQDIEYQLRRIQNVQKLFGPIGENIFLVVDANQGYTMQQAQQLIDGCQGIKNLVFEQPVRYNEYQNLKKLKQQCLRHGFMLSLDETVQSMSAVRYALEHEIGSVFSVKVSKNGGITNLRSVTKLCHAKQVKCLFNSMAEFGIAQSALLNVIAVTPNIVDIGHCFMSTLRFKDDITDFKSLIDEQKIVRLSKKPGLGVAVNEDKLVEFSCKYEKLA